jgi:hypothetical protein
LTSGIFSLKLRVNIQQNEDKMNDTLDKMIDAEFGPHPFLDIPTEADYQKLMANYLAMSQAFPYLQAGSQQDIFLHYMEKNEDIPKSVELTTVVGNFLCWDETGGLFLTIASGMKGLPRLLETRRFHSNLLKSDCEELFGKEIKPDYSALTKEYLLQLKNGLSSLCHVSRVAYMVSFETHANKMIDALWHSISHHFDTEKNKLRYFHTHVGGDDPAEAYHVEMTNKLIAEIVDEDQRETFINHFRDAYRLHSDWCKALTRLS